MTRTFHLIVRCPFCVLRKWGFTMNFIQYIKQAWKAGTSGGTPLSPDRLNHMEDGIKNNNSMISELNNNNITNNICTNLLNPTLKTSSQNGITCTNNGDGTYTLNGTATKSTFFYLGIYSSKANKTYKILGWGNTKYEQNLTGLYIQVKDGRPNVFDSNGNGGFYTPASDESLNVVIAINNGTTISNAIIKPMITTNLNATYNDFVSYTGNTGRLNADVALLNNNLTIKTYNIRDNVPMYTYGKICLIHIDISLNLKVGWNELGTLPSNFSPLTQFEQIVLNGSRKPQGWARVSVNNQVQIYSDVEYSGYIVGEIIYLAK
nr:MAG TPA: hypothetical protein [Bacteriophage sp.]